MKNIKSLETAPGFDKVRLKQEYKKRLQELLADGKAKGYRGLDSVFNAVKALLDAKNIQPEYSLPETEIPLNYEEKLHIHLRSLLEHYAAELKKIEASSLKKVNDAVVNLDNSAKSVIDSVSINQEMYSKISRFWKTTRSALPYSLSKVSFPRIKPVKPFLFPAFPSRGVPVLKNLAFWLDASRAGVKQDGSELRSVRNVSHRSSTLKVLESPIKYVSAGLNCRPALYLSGSRAVVKVRKKGKVVPLNVFAVYSNSTVYDWKALLGSYQQNVTEKPPQKVPPMLLPKVPLNESWKVLARVVGEGVKDKSAPRMSHYSLPPSFFRSIFLGDGEKKLRGLGSKWEGYISEVIMYEGTLNAREIKKIKSYLSEKWAIRIPQSGGKHESSR